LSPSSDPRSAAGPLAGLRVLELANLYSGPLIGALLGDLGADVVKVEPPEGEPFRAIVSRDADDGPSVWTLVSRNKRMVAIDHRHPDGVALLGRLTAAADIIIVNQPPSVLERMGCTYAAISARNPGAVMVNVSGWGDDGPYADRGGNGTIAEAFGGLTDVLATGDDRTLSAALLGDCLTALSGAVGTLAACYWRAVATGEGQYIEVPMFEAVMTAVAPQIVSFRPGAPTPAGGGLRRAMQTADGGWVVATAYTAAQIVRLLEAVGVSVQPTGEDAARPPTDRATLADLVGDWVGRHDLETVMAAFAETRIPATPVNDIAALLADPHVQARAVVVDVETPSHGRVRIPRPTPRLSRTPAPPPRFAERSLGADTTEICAEWLGLPDDEVARLRETNVVVGS
jgi:crotonobetainyl-CoA:carnitine CoA-transferase CaiB-like acyl-CoA transferase